MNEFFYGVLPYIALTIFIGGTIMRYTVYERNWTTKSSEFLSKRDLKWANPLFHIGLFMAFGGHCVGILVPKLCTRLPVRNVSSLDGTAADSFCTKVSRVSPREYVTTGIEASSKSVM